MLLEVTVHISSKPSWKYLYECVRWCLPGWCCL